MASRASEQSIFLHAVGLDSPDERSAYLAEACRHHPGLRAEIDALLAAHDRLGGLPPGAGVPGRPAPDATVEVASAAASERSGAQIGPYKLLQPIGEGGMGTVYMAEQTQPVKRMVALKIIKAGMDTRQVLARFGAERQALALMDHPNIARVLDAGTTDSGRPYFVMELVKGVPITQFCDERRLSTRERVELAIPVCQAVQHAHQKGVIHRDLKPSNVLVALYDDRPVPKVIDFGVAKATGHRLSDQTLFTEFGAVVGTLEYMSPEQAHLNQLDVDTRSDVYSLGVLIYELLTGSTPLERKRVKELALLEVLRAIREEEAPRPSLRLSTTEELPSIAACRQVEPSKLGTLVRGELDWVVMKALEKDRNRRYETANGLAADLRRYLDDEPVLAGPPSAWYRFRKLARRNKAALATATVVAAALLIGIAGATWQAVRATKAEVLAGERLETATANFKEANRQRKLATERGDDLARRLYINKVDLAHRELLANDVAAAEELLDGCEPSSRGWEWAYTKRLCHDEAMTLGFPDHASAVAGARRVSPSDLAANAPADGIEYAGLEYPFRSVRGVAYSPDGRHIASAHDDGAIVLWDAETGREVRPLTGHVGPVTCIAFDAAGARLISGGFDRTVRLWDVNTGEQKLVLRGHDRPVTSVCFRPGADQAASAAQGALATVSRGTEIKQWDLARGREVRTLYNQNAWKNSWVAFTPDGRQLMTSSRYAGQLRTWDAESGKNIAHRLHEDNCCGLAVAPDGRIAVANRYAWLADPAAGLAFVPVGGDGSLSQAVAFSPDGKRLASGAVDGTIRILSLPDGRELKHLRGHTAAVIAVAFNPEGNAIVSGSDDGTVKVWDAGAAQDPYPRDGLGPVNQIAFSPDGRRMALSLNYRLLVADTATDRHIFDVMLDLNGIENINGIGFSRDGRLIAGAIADRAFVRDAETGRPLAACLHKGVVRKVAFGPGNLLATAGDDGSVRFWDAVTGRLSAVIRAHQGRCTSLAFDPSGAAVASAGSDNVVRFWDVPGGRLVRSLSVPVEWKEEALAFSPDGGRLAINCSDGTVRVCEVASGGVVLKFRAHVGGVRSVIYSPDGRRIVTGGSSDFAVKLWDAATGDNVFTLRGHRGGVTGLAFHPDGRRFISGDWNGLLCSWEAAPREILPDAARSRPTPAEWMNQGARLARLGRRQEAVAAYTHAIELEPDSWPAIRCRADLYADMRIRDRAVADYARVLDLNPRNAYLHDTLARELV